MYQQKRHLLYCLCRENYTPLTTFVDYNGEFKLRVIRQTASKQTNIHSSRNIHKNPQLLQSLAMLEDKRMQEQSLENSI
jgi:hypothetical protein